LLGYFFGPARDDVPRIDELDRLDASNADLARKFGDLGLRSGTWPLIGSLSSWDRNQWPMPDFRRYEELTGRTFVVTYSDADPNQVERERLSTPDDTINLPKDGLAGAGFVEVVLTELLRRHS
jgi:hypothetical protein